MNRSETFIHLLSKKPGPIMNGKSKPVSLGQLLEIIEKIPVKLLKQKL